MSETFEFVALHWLDEFKGNFPSPRYGLAQLSPLNQLCLTCDKMISIFNLPIYASESSRLAMLRYDLEKKKYSAIPTTTSAGLFSKINGFSFARWSPLGKYWKGSLLAVSTMEGNVIVYACESGRDDIQKWNVLWEWAESNGNFIYYLNWQCHNDELLLLVSVRNEGLMTFIYNECSFKLKQQDSAIGFINFVYLKDSLLGLTVKKDVIFNGKEMLQCKSPGVFMKVLNSEFLVIFSIQEKCVFNLNSNRKYEIPCSDILDLVDCEFYDNKILIFTAGCELFVFDLLNERFYLNSEHEEFVSKIIDSGILQPIVESKYYDEGKRSFICIGACGTLNAVKYLVMARVTLSGFRDFFIFSYLNKSYLSVSSSEINFIYRTTLFPDEKEKIMNTCAENPNAQYLLATFLKDQGLICQTRELLTKFPAFESFYDVCQWSGEVLRTPFNLVCIFCKAKYKLEAPVLNCVLCNAPVVKSKFCND